TNDEENVMKISRGLPSERGNVANHLLGKPPNPPKGDKLEKVTNISLYTYSALVRHIPSCRWLPSKGEYGDGKEKG
ncbi:hypothetical protein, partial [Capnocytophaga sp. oral taxon 380]|uniref:hypothetical protein n=1 Tax=Capnocytophaga sp. oral taxon 380 TaxID=712217 RepID=UPI0002A44739